MSTTDKNLDGLLENTEKKIREETLKILDEAKSVLRKIAEIDSESSKRYIFALSEYEDLRKNIIENFLQDQKITETELTEIRKDFEGNFYTKAINIIKVYKERGSFSAMSRKEKEALSDSSDESLFFIKSKQDILDFYDTFPKHKEPKELTKLHPSLKTDKEVIQKILLESDQPFDENIAKYIPREFFQTKENVDFLIKNSKFQESHIKNLFLTSILRKCRDNLPLIKEIINDKNIFSNKEESIYFIPVSISKDRGILLELGYNQSNIETLLKSQGENQETAKRVIFKIQKNLPLNERELGVLSTYIELHGTKKIEGELLMLFSKRNNASLFLDLEVLHDDLDFMKKLIERNPDFGYQEYVSVDVAENKDFQQKRKRGLRRIEREEREKQKEGKSEENKKDIFIPEEAKESNNIISSLNLTSEEAKTLTSDELTIIQNSPKEKDNFLRFKDTLRDLNMEDIWMYRNSIFKVIGGSNTLGFSTSDGDYLSINEIKIFLGSVIYSIKDKLDKSEQGTVQQLKGGKLSFEETTAIIKQINRVSPLIGEKNNGKLVNARSRIGGFFQEKFITLGGSIPFKKDEFEESLKK